MKKSTLKKIEKAILEIEDIKANLDDIYEEERATFDDRSDKYKESEKGSNIESSLDALESAINDIDSGLGSLGDIASYLE